MRLKSFYSDKGIIFLFHCFCLIVSLSHTTPTSFLEKPTLPSLIQLEKRDTPTRPHPHQILSGRSPLHLDSVGLGPNGTEETMLEIALINSLNTGTGAGVYYAEVKLFKASPKVNDVYVAIALIPGFILCYGSFSSFLKEKLYLGEAMMAVLFGIIIGPHVAGLFEPRTWGNGENFNAVTVELTRIIVALDVFSAGVELPAAYILRHWQTMVCLLGPVVLAGWFISGALIFALVPALSYLEALVIAACVCPTDILLASSVVGKGRYAQRHVPSHIQHLLQAEAGANDGVAIILLYLVMFLLLKNDHSVGQAVGNWVLLGVLYHIVCGILMGVVTGIIARKTLQFAKERSMIDKESMVAMYITLALLTAAVSILAGTDDIVAAFACGTAFGWDQWCHDDIHASNFSQILSHLVNTSAFIYVGATIPFTLWNAAMLTLTAWKMVLLALSILLLRRLPVILLMRKLIPDIKTNREALFVGHFGPIGVSGLFISILATGKLPTPQIPPQSSLDVLALTIQPIMYLLLCFSVFIHGLSIPFFNISKSLNTRVNSIRRSGTFTASIRSGRLHTLSRCTSVNADNNINNLARYNSVNTDDLPGGRGFPAASPTPSLSPTMLSPATNCNMIPLGQLAGAEAHDECEADGTKGSHDDHDEEVVLKDEKKMPVDWVEPHLVDSTDGVKMYKCGQHLVIERGDGKEVEIWRLQPASFLGPNHLPGPADAPRHLRENVPRNRVLLNDFETHLDSPALLHPVPSTSTSDKSRMHDEIEKDVSVPEEFNAGKDLAGSPVRTPPGDDPSSSDEWLEEGPIEPEPSRSRSQLSLVLRDRRFSGHPGRSTGHPTKRGPSKWGIMKYGGTTSKSFGSSQPLSSMEKSSRTYTDTQSYPQLRSPKMKDEDEKPSLRPPSKANSTCSSSGADQGEPKPRQRNRNASYPSQVRRVSFVDCSDGLSDGPHSPV
ncbi:hypothetical protein Pst134EA_020714 [Puccinia striiformis f. sp. tritici]|uniref:hypothetical protein n=1 Tax=Puccinia striiformis f. sp. tritici TaxID=168172 RepID=UPI002007C8B8|nr:hypothetical protein Pst134EA_020714 [Puccinia striiformis f. sp. tritici]KAH9456804.1 hypothetical protein Pst134EA_020714 [Puccinia striiformis f. sp. tritici]